MRMHVPAGRLLAAMAAAGMYGSVARKHVCDCGRRPASTTWMVSGSARADVRKVALQFADGTMVVWSAQLCDWAVAERPSMKRKDKGFMICGCVEVKCNLHVLYK
jgi:hypothetical protein